MKNKENALHEIYKLYYEKLFRIIKKTKLKKMKGLCIWDNHLFFIDPHIIVHPESIHVATTVAQINIIANNATTKLHTVIPHVIPRELWWLGILQGQHAGHSMEL